MYSIAIIDDEAIVREGMAELIPWGEIGLELIGTAEDGEEGLVLIEDKHPDIILLDINMPKLNGLDLAGIIKKTNTLTKIILISGYDEFDYARQALRMGVEDYILKPVTKSEMVGLLKKVVSKLNQEKEENKLHMEVLNKIDQSIPLMQQRLLEQLIFEEIEENLVIKRCIKANIPYNKRYYAVFLIDADAMIPGENQEKQKELTYFAIHNIANEILLSKNLGAVFEIDHINAVLYFTDQGMHLAKEYHEVMMHIKQSITELLGITVTIGVGSLVESICGISISYDEAYHALSSRFFQGTDRIIDNIKPYKYKRVHFKKWVEWENKVISSLGEKDGFEKAIGEVCKDIRKNKMHIEDIEELWNTICSSMFKQFIDIDPTIVESFPDGINIVEEVRKFKTLSDIQAWINGIYHKCNEYIGNQSKPNKIYTKNIVTYIEENYSLPELSMKMVCEHAHMSSSHLSNILKKEIGCTFIQYLIEYRIEKAKQLLKYTHLKTYEIAENVGYMDAQYFSTLFKKQVGMSPSEYRKSHGDGYK